MEKCYGLATELGNRLKAKGWMMTSAESCTGGGVAYCATEIAGSSQWLERSFVTYSNQSKQEMLGVQTSTLEKYGAVSEAVVSEMATGALKHSGAQVSVAISGIAGPGGATETKPVGTVCFGWADIDGQLLVETHYFIGDRKQVREQAIETALQGLTQLLE
ncbi:CinA family protein [Vibrio sp. Of7-15]|uniref:CinA family protein n=1 Tax=Vibrio sp. Of7-15 TaxID=2724879 RepID=UPI001EF1E46C|nr:CinA family protein [Vibrio sp. Of7-15]MCG7499088.1 CinA family protein [Vibrio sp. Of7-15]